MRSCVYAVAAARFTGHYGARRSAWKPDDGDTSTVIANANLGALRMRPRPRTLQARLRPRRFTHSTCLSTEWLRRSVGCHARVHARHSNCLARRQTRRHPRCDANVLGCLATAGRGQFLLQLALRRRDLVVDLYMCRRVSPPLRALHACYSTARCKSRDSQGHASLTCLGGLRAEKKKTGTALAHVLLRGPTHAR